MLAVLLLLPAAVLSGCISQPSTELTVRRGDLVRAELAVWNASGVVFPVGAELGAACRSVPAGGDPGQCTVAQRSYVVYTEVPATLPTGWENATPLPRGLVDRLQGMAEGAQAREEDVLAFGERSEDLVETHPRTTSLPRVVEASEAYGRTWNTTPLEDGTHRIEPTQEDQGRTLEVQRWCNDRFCLFESQLVDWNETHLQVAHRAQVGDQVHVAELDTWLTVTHVDEQTLSLDNNDPRAGQGYEVHIRIHEIRAPPEGQRRAPAFSLTTLDGQPVNLTDYAGQPLILEFFASWCPSCRKNTEHLSLLQRTYGDGIAILAIGVDPWEDRDQLESFIQANDVTWPIAMDKRGDVSKAYRVGSLSTEVVVSPTGAIVHMETGVADHERVSRIVHDLLPPDHHGDGQPEDHP